MPVPWISSAAKKLTEKDPGGGGEKRKQQVFSYHEQYLLKQFEPENFTMDYRCKQERR